MSAAITHAQLVDRAVRWLQGAGRCTFAFSEFRTYTVEIPDAIGFRAWGAVVVECKTSRSDFLRDRLKTMRRMPQMGMGLERYYMVPAGLIKVEDLPDKWGLLYVHGRHVRIIRKSGGFPERAWRAEMGFLVSMLRRIEIRAREAHRSTDKCYSGPPDFLNQWIRDSVSLRQVTGVTK